MSGIVAFSTLLASTVHDMKNSIGMLLQSVERVVATRPDLDDHDRKDLASMQYEAARVNAHLVQLLSMYKMDTDRLPLMMDAYNVSEFLHEQALQHHLLLEMRGITTTVECDDWLEWLFDRSLVAGVLNNITTNCIRYTRDAILLRAWEENGMLQLEVVDNGPGYPEAMLKAGAEYMQGVDFCTGSTGLGLYFSGQVARLHEKRGRCGSMSLRNDGPMGGGVFRLSLP